MTPITIYRKHPVYDAISGALRCVKARYFVFNMARSNLCQAHIRCSRGRALEHIMIAPTHRQIQHALAPERRHRSGSEVLANSDWMFSTLYIPRGASHWHSGWAALMAIACPSAATLGPGRCCCCGETGGNRSAT